MTQLGWLPLKHFRSRPRKDIKRAKADFVHNKISSSLAEGNSKPFWSYIKGQRQESVGIPPLRRNEGLFSSAKDKAEILLAEFKSLFTNRQKCLCIT